LWRQARAFGIPGLANLLIGILLEIGLFGVNMWLKNIMNANQEIGVPRGEIGNEPKGQVE
jgi:formate hydrogenlyase subunit 3/multisubunit Na+/H+ antiporter MnhD subunit